MSLTLNVDHIRKRPGRRRKRVTGTNPATQLPNAAPRLGGGGKDNPHTMCWSIAGSGKASSLSSHEDTRTVAEFSSDFLLHGPHLMATPQPMEWRGLPSSGNYLILLEAPYAWSLQPEVIPLSILQVVGIQVFTVFGLHSFCPLSKTDSIANPKH